MEMQAGFKLLKKYKIPIVDQGIAKKPDQAVRIAKIIGYPLAIKVDSSAILHKTDKGCVAFDIKNEKELIEAFKRVKKNAGRAKINGIIVQKHLKGREIIIGGKHDPQFGETVLFGLGGIFVEVFKDVALRVTPFSRRDALSMIKETKGYQLLSGARGEKPVNINSIVSTIMKVQKLMEENNIKELDINPLFVDEQGITAVDVRIIK
ncbi:acetate--CoA ligase family protein [archaeon]|nr:acetate--CoA ligase family protein [archaeon]